MSFYSFIHTAMNGWDPFYVPRILLAHGIHRVIRIPAPVEMAANKEWIQQVKHGIMSSEQGDRSRVGSTGNSATEM